MKRRNVEREDDDNGFGEWGGYMAAKKAKLLEQFNSEENKNLKSMIFKGIAILVNGYTKPSSEELKQIMTEHGGIFHIYRISGLTTHIIASNLPNVKINHLGNIPIVKPTWIVDSVNAMKLLDYKLYLLYTNESVTQLKLKFEKKALNTSENMVTEKIINTDDKIISNTSTSKTALTATDPRFISEFYNNSRLHLIATLGAEFKQLVCSLREKSDGQFAGLDELKKLKTTDADKSEIEKVIMHIDMDCFFVSVGLRNRPDLKGKPVAVTHARGNKTNSNNVDRQVEFSLYMQRLPEGATGKIEDLDNNSSMSEIASCSYEARKYGIKNGMFLGVALKMCPDLKTIPYDFEGYKEVSKILYYTIANYTLDIEAVSCDEMYVDITRILQETNWSVYEWADYIREEIICKTGCPCSTGFGSNRLQARLATKKAKPAGKYHLKASDVETYFYNIDLSELPGVGRATLSKLRNMNFKTCGDLQTKSLKFLQTEFGSKNGETLYDQIRGVDKRPLNFDHSRRSVSAEVNYGIRFVSHKEALTFLQSLSEEVAIRLKDTGMKAKTVTLKLLIRAEEAPTETAKFLGHGVCDALSRSVSTHYLIFEPNAIFKEIKILYERLNVKPSDLRGLGIQLSRLEKEQTTNAILKNFLKNDNVKLKDAKKLKTESSTQSKSITSTDIFSTKTSFKSNQKPGSNKTDKVAKNTETNNLNAYFKNAKSDFGNKNKQHSYKYVDIDLNVLNELPEDIKAEIITEHKLTNLVTSKNGNNFIENQSKKVEDSTKNTKSVNVKKIETKDKTGFDTLNYEELKTVLIQWLNFKKGPKETDIKMLGNYFRQLAIDREIDKLHVIIKFLFRHINKSTKCNWHEAYFKILNYVQDGMIATYGNTLLVPRTFNCPIHTSQ